MTFRLNTLLERRRERERRADEGLARALAALARSQEAQTELDAAVAGAEEKLNKLLRDHAGAARDAGKAAAGSGSWDSMSARDGRDWERFRHRLSAELARCRHAAAAHAEGHLRRAREALAAARAACAEARNQRQAIEDLKRRDDAAAHRVAESRRDEAASEMGLASHRAKSQEDQGQED
jgi:hypothetical protein